MVDGARRERGRTTRRYPGSPMEPEDLDPPDPRVRILQWVITTTLDGT